MPQPAASTVRPAASLLAAALLLSLSPGVMLPQGATPAPAPGPATPPGAIPAAPDYAGQREAIFDAFYKTGLDGSAPYAVANLSIVKDNMTILLKQGTLFFMKPISGEITGAAFLGEGEASMTPPNRTERFMLQKHSGAETFRQPFSEAVFRFSDGTDKTLRAAARPDPAGAPKADAAEKVLKDRNQWLDGERSLHLEMQFLETRISGLQGQDFFLADLHTTAHDWLTYRYNPQEINENRLHATATMGGGGRRYMIPWTEWHKKSDYGPSGHYLLIPDKDGARVIRMRHTDLELDLKTTKTVHWLSRTTVEPLVGPLRCVRFDLVNNANLDSRWFDDSFWPSRILSVTDEKGDALPFMHKKDQLLIVLPSPAPAGAPLPLATRGQADVIYQVTPESFGLLQAQWFPQYGFKGGRYTFHWTIKVPKPFRVTGSGRLMREFEDKETNQNGIEAQSDIPVSFPWMIFGKFRKAASVYTSEETKKEIDLSIYTVTIGGEGTPAKKVETFLSESQDILRVYENIYGPYPFEELHIAQMGPGLGFGQGPPYFVQLTGELFLPGSSSLGQYSMHDFLSHEIAHQWWANQVGWASGDDHWLSEGFASYAGAIFIHALQKEQGLKRILDEWRRDARLGDKEAPIAAANTLSGPFADAYERSLLYAKAPYVLHMLRVQLDDEKYRQVMRSIQETYRHRDISTEMLLREVNKVTGADYTYFFDQWIWDVGIPTFRYSWRSEKQPDGKHLVTVHVSQDDKARLKKVLMPIHLHFKGKTIPQYKPVVQAEQDIKILAPEEPKNVTLDDDRTLLAEIVKAS